MLVLGRKKNVLDLVIVLAVLPVPVFALVLVLVLVLVYRACTCSCACNVNSSKRAFGQGLLLHLSNPLSGACLVAGAAV